jgi:enolase
MKITSIQALEILDSRGNPTVEVILEINKKFIGTAKVPSGASTGTHEALELRDGDKRYQGKGVQKAVKNVYALFQKIKSLPLSGIKNQFELDKVLLKLDGTENKKKYGANAILGISMAFCVAQAKAKNIELYANIQQEFKKIYKPAFKLTTKKLIPLMNIINGGAHADNPLDIQEFLICPIAPKTIAEKIRAGAEIFHTLKKILKSKKQVTAVGDEGGFAPNLKNTDEALKLATQAIKTAGYTGKVKLALDCAACEYYKNGSYKLDNKTMSSTQLIKYYVNLISKHPLISIEDPFAEDDWSAWTAFTKSVGKKIYIVGDDLFVTNIKRLKQGIDTKAGNSILIKLNQIGTVSETFFAIALAKINGFKTIISHRSGETEDTFIADLAIGVDADYIKTGSLSRSERVAKYNRLIEIENKIK